MKKRGSLTGFNSLKSLITVLIVILVTGTITASFMRDGVTRPMDTSACKIDMLAAQELGGGLTGMGKKQDQIRNCDPGRIVIGSETFEKGEINDVAVKRAIGDALLRCSQFKNLDPVSNYEGKQNYCFICDNINFSKKFQKKATATNYEMTHLWFWLAKTPIPQVLESDSEKKPSYYKAMTGVDLTEEEIKRLELDTETVSGDDFSEPYISLWHIEKHGRSVASEAAIGTVSVILGSAIGIFTNMAITLPTWGGLAVAGFAMQSAVTEVTSKGIKIGLMSFMKATKKFAIKKTVNLAKKAILKKGNIKRGAAFGALIAHQIRDGDILTMHRVYFAPKDYLDMELDITLETTDSKTGATGSEKLEYVFCTRPINY